MSGPAPGLIWGACWALWASTGTASLENSAAEADYGSSLAGGAGAMCHRAEDEQLKVVGGEARMFITSPPSSAFTWVHPHHRPTWASPVACVLLLATPYGLSSP